MTELLEAIAVLLTTEASVKRMKLFVKFPAPLVIDAAQYRSVYNAPMFVPGVPPEFASNGRPRIFCVDRAGV